MMSTAPSLAPSERCSVWLPYGCLVAAATRALSLRRHFQIREPDISERVSTWERRLAACRVVGCLRSAVAELSHSGHPRGAMASEPFLADCCTPGGHPGLAQAPDERTGTYTMINDDFECYVSLPEGAPKGVVLVIHDIFGLRAGRHTQICDELASVGYVTVCPDLFGDGVWCLHLNLRAAAEPRCRFIVVETPWCYPLPFTASA